MASFLFDAPFGPLFAEVTAAGLRRLEFMWEKRVPPLHRAAQPVQEPAGAMSPEEKELAIAVEAQLGEYFARSRRSFDIPLDLNGGSGFRHRVWRAIAEIPYGETLSYAEVAALAGNPTAYRAAGSACGANPIVILIPCHRVVGSDRRLHGFGGGLDTKAWLLAHEGRAVGRQGELIPA